MSKPVTTQEQPTKQEQGFGKAEILLVLITILLTVTVVLYNFLDARRQVQPVIAYASVSSETTSSQDVSAPSSLLPDYPEEIPGANLAHDTDPDTENGDLESNSTSSAASAPTSIGIININTASADLLDRLPGIGSVKAAAILEYRNEYGAFDTLDEITKVKGIGEKTFEKIKPYITVD